MRFPQAEVRQLLKERFDVVEVIWDHDPYDEVNTFALTIKEFMSDHAIENVDEGIQRFIEFKREQTQSLAKVGLGTSTDFSTRLPSSPNLAPQAA